MTLNVHWTTTHGSALSNSLRHTRRQPGGRALSNSLRHTRLEGDILYTMYLRCLRKQSAVIRLWLYRAPLVGVSSRTVLNYVCLDVNWHIVYCRGRVKHTSYARTLTTQAHLFGQSAWQFVLLWSVLISGILPWCWRSSSKC